MKVIVNDILLNHIESGHPHGLPIVFIHGFPFNHSMWEPQLTSLPSTLRLIAYDIRGFGKSDLGNGEKTIDKHADDLVGLLDDLTIDQAIVCGLSMGGYIALRAIEKYPARFKGLVLCDTKSESDNEEGRKKRMDSIKVIEDQGTITFSQNFLKNVLGASTYQNNPQLVRNLQNRILENNQEGIVAAQYAMADRTDTTSSLKKIKVPTLILVGEEDGVTPVKAAQSIREKIPNSQLEIIPKAGHLSNLENPKFFNEKLILFLRKFDQSLPE